MHDHVPAQSLGMSSSYINRAEASVGFVDSVTPTFEFKTLGEMAQSAKEAFQMESIRDTLPTVHAGSR